MENITYRWKGKIVVPIVYIKKDAQQKQQSRKKVVAITEKQKNEPITQENVEEELNFIDGRRIIELKIFGQQLWCSSCKEALSLQYIENETRLGFTIVGEVS